MASIQANPEMPGQGQLPGNITREQVQVVYQVCALLHLPLRRQRLRTTTCLTNRTRSAIKQ